MKLESLRIPPPLRGFAAGDAQVFDVTLEGDRVAAVVPSASQSQARGTLLSALVEAHAHIDKTYTVQEVGAAQGNLFAAIQRMEKHRAGWTAETLRLRMERALRDAWQSGTRALRTHIDWVAPEAPTALAVFEASRDAWRGHVELQFVSLTPLDVFADPAAGERIAREVKRAGGVLGAFVYRNDGIVHKLAACSTWRSNTTWRSTSTSTRASMPMPAGLRSIAQLVRARDFTQGVGLRPLLLAGRAGRCRGRRNARAVRRRGACTSSRCRPPTFTCRAPGTAPRCRAASPASTRRRHGACVPALATDNVQDAFYPYGSYDLLETFGLGVQMAHLAPAGDWLDAVTVSPAKALGLAWDGRIAPGCPADLVLLAATDEHELIGPRGRERTVIRDGRILEKTQ